MKIETEEYTLTYKSDEATKEALFEKVVGFFKEHESFNGESIMQCDGPLIAAPELLSDIADDILCFDVQWKEG